MFENLVFGKTGFKSCVLEKHFISFSCILFLIFNALWSVFKNQVVFFKILFFQIFDWSNLFFDQSKFLLKFFVRFCLFWSIETDFRSIENRKWAFLKVRSWPVQSIFFKKFSNFPIFLWLGKAPQQFFVVFLLNFCKVFPSLSRYVHYTISFSFIFSFTCILSCICGLFSDYAKIGVFDVSSQILWNWSLGFSAIVLYSWSMLVNLINLGF